MAPGAAVTARRARWAQRLREPGFRREVVEGIAGTGLPYTTGEHALVGRMMPDLRLVHGGRRTRLAALRHGARPLLPDPTGDPALLAAAAPWAGRVDVVQARARDRSAPPALPVRPDGYVAWTGPDRPALPEALSTWFGPPRRLPRSCDRRWPI